MKFLNVLLVCLLTSSVAFAQDELVVNGDFELPVVDNEKNWSTYYGQNATPTTCEEKGENECNDGQLIPGWSAIWFDTLFTTQETGRVELQRDVQGDPVVGGITAYSGDQKAELDSHYRFGQESGDNNIVMYQLLNTCPSKPYTLSYVWKARLDIPGNSDLDVLVDETILTQHRSFGELWKTEEFNFIADTDATPLAFWSTGDATSTGAFLDAISVMGEVPDEHGFCTVREEICHKPDSLTMLYDGDINLTDNFIQDPNGVRVIDGVEEGDELFLPRTVKIKAYSTAGILIFNRVVNIGEIFEVEGFGRSTWGKNEIYFQISTVEYNVPLQLVNFQWDEPLAVGDEFGGLAVWGGQCDLACEDDDSDSDDDDDYSPHTWDDDDDDDDDDDCDDDDDSDSDDD